MIFNKYTYTNFSPLAVRQVLIPLSQKK